MPPGETPANKPLFWRRLGAYRGPDLGQLLVLVLSSMETVCARARMSVCVETMFERLKMGGLTAKHIRIVEKYEREEAQTNRPQLL